MFSGELEVALLFLFNYLLPHCLEHPWWTFYTHLLIYYPALLYSSDTWTIFGTGPQGWIGIAGILNFSETFIVDEWGKYGLGYVVGYFFRVDSQCISFHWNTGGMHLCNKKCHAINVRPYIHWRVRAAGEINDPLFYRQGGKGRGDVFNENSVTLSTSE